MFSLRKIRFCCPSTQAMVTSKKSFVIHSQEPLISMTSLDIEMYNTEGFFRIFGISKYTSFHSEFIFPNFVESLELLWIKTFTSHDI